MMLAPILLFVYNRPAHAKRAIEALLHNTLAAESELFIYSDAARSPEDCKSVNEVRSFIHSVNGFKKVHIIEREKNYGLARSIIDGVTTQVNAYGRTIVLEDDLVTAPYFLQFMNSALEMYKDEPRIGHIQACDFTHFHRYRILFLLNGPEAGAGQPGIALGNISILTVKHS